MVDAIYVQDKVYYGYAQSAIRLGTSFDVYRAPNPIVPIQQQNFVQSVLSSFNQTWDYMKANKYGNALWQAVVDGRIVQEGDYLVGTQDRYLATHFIMSMDLLMPINSIECNRVVTIQRPAQNTKPGYQGSYSGYSPLTATVLAQNLPVSILEQNRGTPNRMKLPTDARMPIWTFLAPNLGGVNYQNGDIVTDEVNQRYVMVSPEETEFGWRILLEHLSA